MPKSPDFDLKAAHRYFSVECFNRTWDLIDKSERSAEEDDEMIRLSQAALWHWTQRDDCTQKNMSIGYWQLSRVYALAGQVENARRYGQLCLAASQGDDIPAFCLGYAYEALARTESAAGNHEQMEAYLHEARRVADIMTDVDDQKQLLADVDTIGI